MNYFLFHTCLAQLMPMCMTFYLNLLLQGHWAFVLALSFFIWCSYRCGRRRNLTSLQCCLAHSIFCLKFWSSMASSLSFRYLARCHSETILHLRQDFEGSDLTEDTVKCLLVRFGFSFSCLLLDYCHSSCLISEAQGFWVTFHSSYCCQTRFLSYSASGHSGLSCPCLGCNSYPRFRFGGSSLQFS